MKLSVKQLETAEKQYVAIRAGDDIKTVQEHLGHATAAFTLDVYGHFTDQMHKESAVRMDRFIENVLTG